MVGISAARAPVAIRCANLFSARRLRIGHPIGASGVRMVYGVVTPLRGEGGERQIKDAKLDLAHNVGGPGAVSCVSTLGLP